MCVLLCHVIVVFLGLTKTNLTENHSTREILTISRPCREAVTSSG